jgi:pilus assembly protein Flp/PilA
LDQAVEDSDEALRTAAKRRKGITTMLCIIQNFFGDSSGATAIEYALLASLIGVAIVTTVTAVGANLSNSYSNIAAAFG